SDTHYLAGQLIPTGFDDYGYNYQGHMFRGSYYNSYAGGAGYPPWTGDDEAYLAENPGAASHWAWPYRDVTLAMKWNDAWISNKDYDMDGYLDRHPGYSGYPDSGAWLTNHQSGEYLDETGELVKWNYFVKIVTPSPINGDVLIDGIWYDADGVEIGPVIWGAFAIVMQVENDPGADLHGVSYISPCSAGLGYYQDY
ncbi:MAG: hypothetical protein NWF07_03325, partial [Candidatus Bathyarchaeota archaeon]|nr:hypothetical protein [Candidatus Bathyarchaeota archaeon]